VSLEDWVAGGLEPVDPNVDASALNDGASCGGLYRPMRGGGGARPMGGREEPPMMRPPMGGGMMGGGRRMQYGGADFGAYYYWFSCVSFARQTRPDRVSYYSRFVRAGTHSVTYQAMAATSGTFVLPPAQASLALQPEVMGLSASGSFEVSRTPLTAAQMALPPATAPLGCPESCPDDCDVETAVCTPAAPATVAIAAGAGAAGGACSVAAMQAECGTVDVKDPRNCLTGCYALVKTRRAQCDDVIRATPALADQMTKFADMCSGH
jgi:hypothetical protein